MLCMCSSNFSFDFFPLTHIMVMNLRQRKRKIKLVCKFKTKEKCEPQHVMGVVWGRGWCGEGGGVATSRGSLISGNRYFRRVH